MLLGVWEGRGLQLLRMKLEDSNGTAPEKLDRLVDRQENKRAGDSTSYVLVVVVE